MQHNKPFDPSKPVVVSQPVSVPQSTGPRTDAGRAISSRNATKHGCCSEETLILKDENIEDYKALEAVWLNAYHPKDQAETHLIEQLVTADWFLARSTRVLAEVEARTYSFAPEPINWSEFEHNRITRFMRYQTARANAVIKARKAVEDYRKNRANEKIKTEKQEIYKEKAKPEPTIEELLDQMMADKADRDLKKQSNPALK